MDSRIETFVARLGSEVVPFADTLALISELYEYTPTAFSNGVGEDRLDSPAGVNEGSCKVFVDSPAGVNEGSCKVFVSTACRRRPRWLASASITKRCWTTPRARGTRTSVFSCAMAGRASALTGSP